MNTCIDVFKLILLALSFTLFIIFFCIVLEVNEVKIENLIQIEVIFTSEDSLDHKKQSRKWYFYTF